MRSGIVAAVLVAVAVLAACSGDADASGSPFALDAEFSTQDPVTNEQEIVEDFAAIEERVGWDLPLPDAPPEGVTFTRAQGVPGLRAPESTIGSMISIQTSIPARLEVASFPGPTGFSPEGRSLEIGEFTVQEIIPNENAYILAWNGCRGAYSITAAPDADRDLLAAVAEAFLQACVNSE